MRTRIWSWSLACALVATSTESRAQAPAAADTANAQTLFKAAKALVAAGKIDDACPKFEASFKLVPKTATLLNLADCYERQGKYATAFKQFGDAEELARTQKRADREALARRRIAALAPRLAKMTVVAPAGATGLEAKVDGTLIAAPLLGMAFPVDAGRHAIEASAPGKQTWSSTVDVGDAAAVTVTIPALADVAPAAPPAPPEPPPPPSPNVDTSAPKQVALNEPQTPQTDAEKADDQGRDAKAVEREEAMAKAGRNRVRVPIMASFIYGSLGELDFKTPGSGGSCQNSEVDMYGWHGIAWGASAGIRFALSRALDLYLGGSFQRGQGSASKIVCGSGSSNPNAGNSPTFTFQAATFDPELRILPGQQFFYIGLRGRIGYAWGTGSYQDQNGANLNLDTTKDGSSLGGPAFGGGLALGLIFGPKHSIEAAFRVNALASSWLTSGVIPGSEAALGWAF
jgi:hypothetical protein